MFVFLQANVTESEPPTINIGKPIVGTALSIKIIHDAFLSMQ